jgi:cytochrome c-type biogenesis protein CcmE
MNALRQRRLLFVILLLFVSILVAFLVVNALKQNINLFYTPTQILNNEAPLGKRIRVGGMVQKGSLTRQESLRVQFDVTDFFHQITIRYTGILPDLFREDQGIVAMGYLDVNKIFVADEILAKHDENYMPSEVRQLLKKKKDAMDMNREREGLR